MRIQRSKKSDRDLSDGEQLPVTAGFQTAAPRMGVGGPMGVAGMLALQRAVGNAAATHLVTRTHGHAGEPPAVQRVLSRPASPERQDTRPGPRHEATTESSVSIQRAGYADHDWGHQGLADEPHQITLTGIYVRQGNGNGAVTDSRNSVLYTSDLAPCVAVCGYNGRTSFMIHSDSTLTGGIGHLELMDGIKRLVSIGDGAGWTISLIGGSTRGTRRYLTPHLPGATFHDLGAADGAYITETGLVAPTKRQLAALLDAASVDIR